ncbi:DUF6883 domain-containing protein [Geminocystis herdmanii]|uniref:DUF6883 domain-containing protein n=1 Tax=Geminocystis herdmanii TaxID=669359 RepID=UPI001ED98DF0|nr:DUF6883 domain-containing protein [Geminocystis herdmanii]
MSFDKLISPNNFDIPLAKVQYLFSRGNGKGGDKQKFWREIMGFISPEGIKEAILKEVNVDLLEPQNQNEFGQLYRAYIDITGKSGITRRIRTVWIVLFNDNVAKLVIAFPDRLGG